MKITNAIIKNVTTFRSNLYGIISVSIDFAGADNYCGCNLLLTEIADLRRLIRLMEYVEVSNISDLNGKIVRKVVDSKGILLGFGHPIDDMFVITSNEAYKEVGEKYFDSIKMNES